MSCILLVPVFAIIGLALGGWATGAPSAPAPSAGNWRFSEDPCRWVNGDWVMTCAYPRVVINEVTGSRWEGSARWDEHRCKMVVAEVSVTLGTPRRSTEPVSVLLTLTTAPDTP